MNKTKADILYESLANFTDEEGAIECGAKMRDYARELEHFLDGERIARQYAIDKGVELQRVNELLMTDNVRIGRALIRFCDELVLEGIPIPDYVRDSLNPVSFLPNV